MIEFTKGTSVYYLFKCDKCRYIAEATKNPGKYKLNLNPEKKTVACVVCEKEDGILKAFETNSD